MREILVFLLFTLFIFQVNAQTSDYLKTDNQLYTNIDSAVHQQISEIIKNCTKIGISIGISMNNKSYFYNYGTIEKGKQKLPGRNTVYEIGSITKTFTGILLANAVMENKLNLDDDIRNYLDDDYENLQYKGNPICILNLANHTSGLPEDIIPEEIFTLKNPTMFDIINIFEGDTLSMFLNGLKKVKPDTLPGAKIKYSNTGMITLGIILEKVYGTSYSNLIKRYFTTPMAMNHTETVYYRTDTDNYTKGYDKKGNIMPHITFQIAGAAGGLKSTTHDMVLYLNKNIETIDEAIILSHTKTTENDNQAFGLGWQIRSDSKFGTQFWHDGGEPGFSSYCLIIPEKKMGIICLANQRGCQYQFSKLSIGIIEALLK